MLRFLLLHTDLVLLQDGCTLSHPHLYVLVANFESISVTHTCGQVVQNDCFFTETDPTSDVEVDVCRLYAAVVRLLQCPLSASFLSNVQL